MFSKILGEKLDKYHLLKHPFYQVYWNEGKLNREIIKEPYTHSDYYNRFMQRETLRDIACREKQLAQYDWEDTMRLGIGRMNEWDRGYYEDNPYCYGWEINSIAYPTYEEDYYEENSDDELSEEELDEEELNENNEADEIFVLDD